MDQHVHVTQPESLSDLWITLSLFSLSTYIQKSVEVFGLLLKLSKFAVEIATANATAVQQLCIILALTHRYTCDRRRPMDRHRSISIYIVYKYLDIATEQFEYLKVVSTTHPMS